MLNNKNQNHKIKKELYQIKTIEEQIDREDLIYETGMYLSFGDSIFNVKICKVKLITTKAIY